MHRPANNTQHYLHPGGEHIQPDHSYAPAFNHQHVTNPSKATVASSKTKKGRYRFYQKKKMAKSMQDLSLPNYYPITNPSGESSKQPTANAALAPPSTSSAIKLPKWLRRKQTPSATGANADVDTSTAAASRDSSDMGFGHFIGRENDAIVSQDVDDESGVYDDRESFMTGPSSLANRRSKSGSMINFSSIRLWESSSAMRKQDTRRDEDEFGLALSSSERLNLLDKIPPLVAISLWPNKLTDAISRDSSANRRHQSQLTSSTVQHPIWISCSNSKGVQGHTNYIVHFLRDYLGELARAIAWLKSRSRDQSRQSDLEGLQPESILSSRKRSISTSKLSSGNLFGSKRGGTRVADTSPSSRQSIDRSRRSLSVESGDRSQVDRQDASMIAQAMTRALNQMKASTSMTTLPETITNMDQLLDQVTFEPGFLQLTSWQLLLGGTTSGDQRSHNSTSFTWRLLQVMPLFQLWLSFSLLDRFTKSATFEHHRLAVHSFYSSSSTDTSSGMSSDLFASTESQVNNRGDRPRSVGDFQSRILLVGCPPNDNWLIRFATDREFDKWRHLIRTEIIRSQSLFAGRRISVKVTNEALGNQVVYKFQNIDLEMRADELKKSAVQSMNLKIEEDVDLLFACPPQSSSGREEYQEYGLIGCESPFLVAFCAHHNLGPSSCQSSGSHCRLDNETTTVVAGHNLDPCDPLQLKASRCAKLMPLMDPLIARDQLGVHFIARSRTWTRRLSDGDSDKRSKSQTRLRTVKAPSDGQKRRGRSEVRAKSIMNLTSTTSNRNSSLSSITASVTGMSKRGRMRPTASLTDFSRSTSSDVLCQMFGQLPGKVWPDGEIPQSLVCLFVIIYYAGHSIQGIFRRSVVQSQIEAMRLTVDANIEPITPDNCSPLLAACVLKKYFGSIPGHLLIDERWDTWTKITQLTSSSEKLKAIQKLIKTLPSANQTLISLLFFLLERIRDNNETNLMSTNALATVWAPNLLQPPDQQQGALPQSAVDDSLTSIRVVTALLDPEWTTNQLLDSGQVEAKLERRFANLWFAMTGNRPETSRQPRLMTSQSKSFDEGERSLARQTPSSGNFHRTEEPDDQLSLTQAVAVEDSSSSDSLPLNNEHSSDSGDLTTDSDVSIDQTDVQIKQEVISSVAPPQPLVKQARFDDELAVAGQADEQKETTIAPINELPATVKDKSLREQEVKEPVMQNKTVDRKRRTPPPIPPRNFKTYMYRSTSPNVKLLTLHSPSEPGRQRQSVIVEAVPTASPLSEPPSTWRSRLDRYETRDTRLAAHDFSQSRNDEQTKTSAINQSIDRPTRRQFSPVTTHSPTRLAKMSDATPFVPLGKQQTSLSRVGRSRQKSVDYEDDTIDDQRSIILSHQRIRQILAPMIEREMQQPRARPPTVRANWGQRRQTIGYFNHHPSIGRTISYHNDQPTTRIGNESDLSSSIERADRQWTRRKSANPEDQSTRLSRLAKQTDPDQVFNYVLSVSRQVAGEDTPVSSVDNRLTQRRRQTRRPIIQTNSSISFDADRDSRRRSRRLSHSDFDQIV